MSPDILNRVFRAAPKRGWSSTRCIARLARVNMWTTAKALEALQAEGVIYRRHMPTRRPFWSRMPDREA